MPIGRIVSRSIFGVLIVVLLAALLPSATLAAPGGKAREYIVTLDVADSSRVIKPSSRSARQRIGRRNERADQVTARLGAKVGFKARYSYGNAMTGFSAKLTPEQAAEVARDSSVVNVRPARRFRIADQVVPVGIARVKALASGGSTADVDADVAVLDTGIGPDDGNGDPVPIGPSGNRELNIAGGDQLLR